MTDSELLVDLLSQLEEVKFRQLFRTLIDHHTEEGGESVTYATSRSYVFARYVPAGVFTSDASFFQLAYLPASLSEESSIRPFFSHELRTGLEDLRLLGIPPFGPEPPWGLPPPNLPFVVRRDYHQPGAYTYYFVTNLHNAYVGGHGAAAMEHSGSYQDAQTIFSDVLGMSFAPEAWRGMEFGIGSPLTIAQRPEAVCDELVRLLNAPSDYAIVARQGELALVPTVNHGLFFASEGEQPGEIAGVPTGMSATICSAKPLDNANSALQELETLIRAPRIRERDLQQFFEEHPQFLTCLDERYSEVRSHVCLVDSAGNKLVPDFMMRIEDSDVWDVIELKLPKAPLLVETMGVSRPSAVAARGIAELLKYREYFAVAANRKRFAARYHAHGYEPALTLVLGRSPQAYDWSSVKGRFPHVRVLSYDMLFQRAQHCKTVIDQSTRPDVRPPLC